MGANDLFYNPDSGGASGVTEEKVIELINESKKPLFFDYTEDGVIQTNIDIEDKQCFIVTVQNNGEYANFLYNRFSGETLFINDTDNQLGSLLEFDFVNNKYKITFNGTFDPEEGLDCTIYPLN